MGHQKTTMEIGHPIIRIRVIRGESLTMWMLTSFMSLKELNMNFQPLELLSRIELLKKRMESYKKWLR